MGVRKKLEQSIHDYTTSLRRYALTGIYSSTAGHLSRGSSTTAVWPICIGRRNWLFARSDTGGEARGRIMTFVVGAEVNSLDLQAYFADLRDRMHNHKINWLNILLP